MFIVVNSQARQGWLLRLGGARDREREGERGREKERKSASIALLLPSHFMGER